MLNYIITDGHGSYIRKDSYSGKYVPIKNVMFAEKFEERCKAVNILKNGLSKQIRSQYSVKELEEKSPEEPVTNNVKKIETVLPAEVEKYTYTSQSDKWKDGVKQITVLISDAEKRKSELIEQLSYVDKEISDINHYIEFGKFNAYQGWLTFDMLRKKLVKRRQIKNELCVINELGSCSITSDMMSEIDSAITRLGNRKYKPRVLTQLFE